MKMRPGKELTLLLERYRSGKCSEKEMSLLLLWMEQLDVRAEGQALSEEALQEMQSRMYQHIMHRPVMHPAAVVRMRRWHWVAASVVLLAGLAGVISWLVRENGKNAAETAFTYKRIINPGSGVKEIKMPDGTYVWLNGFAVLEVDANYNKHSRNVKLEGEAFFEVAKDETRPFMVETGQLCTQVLGTGFNIEAYGAESEIRVSLLHGSVQIENQKVLHKTLLHPGEMARYQKKAGSIQVLPIAAQHIQEWIEGRLVFNEVPLSEALHRVEQRYGIHIAYTNKLVENKRVTAVFSGKENWPAILKTMLFVHNLDFYQRSDTAYIKK